MTEFEHLGYFREYYIGNKFIGNIYLKEMDRELTGYAGRKNETLNKSITLENGKKIKSGTEIMTMTYPLNGKRI